jgi:hypothetical protein
MTKEQQERIDRAKLRVFHTGEKIRQVDDKIKKASREKPSKDRDERLRDLGLERDAAIEADSAAQDEVEAAHRDAGIDV